MPFRAKLKLDPRLNLFFPSEVHAWWILQQQQTAQAVVNDSIHYYYYNNTI